MARRPRHLPEEVSSSPGYVVLDGGRAGARSLIDSGCLLGLTTGNVGRGSTRFFSFGGYGSHSADRTELTCTALERAACVSAGISHPTPAWPVGDTARDVEAGPGAGIRVVGVASGEYGVSELRETGADFTLASMSERLPVL